jgi:hypothetical protein
MVDKQYILTVGIPGSRWGRLESILCDTHREWVDSSSWKNYTMDMPLNNTGHMHSFWGPYNRLGAEFDQLDLLGPEQFKYLMDKEFEPNNTAPYRFIRCHWFCYQLEWLEKNCPDMWILLMFREPEMSLRWWHESGSWDISYPNYKWYGTSDVLERQANVENKYMHKFIKDRGLTFDYSLKDADKWYAKHMPELGDLSGIDWPAFAQPDGLDRTLWPILYKVKGNKDAKN